MSQTQYYQTGPNPKVQPGISQVGPGQRGILGAVGPGIANTEGLKQYPPTSGGGPTSILPHWLAAAVEAGKQAMRRTFSVTQKNAMVAPNQGFGADAVNLPAGQAIPYGASPRLYAEYVANNGRGYGIGPTQMYSTFSGKADDMPAFQINGPMGQGHLRPDLDTNQNFFGPQMRSGIPTFFPVGNRSLNTNVGTGVDSHPTGVTYLVVPPDRYRRPNRKQPMRGKTGASGGKISRGGTIAMIFGT